MLVWGRVGQKRSSTSKGVGARGRVNFCLLEMQYFMFGRAELSKNAVFDVRIRRILLYLQNSMKPLIVQGMILSRCML